MPSYKEKGHILLFLTVRQHNNKPTNLSCKKKKTTSTSSQLLSPRLKQLTILYTLAYRELYY